MTFANTEENIPNEEKKTFDGAFNMDCIRHCAIAYVQTNWL